MLQNVTNCRSRNNRMFPKCDPNSRNSGIKLSENYMKIYTQTDKIHNGYTHVRTLKKQNKTDVRYS